MQNVHAKVKELAVKKQLGHIEAEQELRFQAHQGDEAAKKIVGEIDAEREAAKKAKLAANQRAASALGLSMDQARDLVEKFYKSPALLTWLSGRVHLAILHDRMPADDE